MKPPRFLFRADASVEIGTGHVMRCLTLARSLERAGAHVRFLSRRRDSDPAEFIRASGFRAESFDSGPDAAWEADADETLSMARLEEGELSWVVVDHYGLDARWEARVRSGSGARILVIDDLADRPHDCELLLDQNLVRSLEERYDGLVPPRTQRLLGPRYALLREEFHDARRRLRARDGTIHRVLVLFGGSDPRGDTVRTLSILARVLPEHVALDVVVGALAKNIEAVNGLAAGRPRTVCHVQTRQVANLMLGADLLVGASGTSSWERCFLGLPAITIVAAENQQEVASVLAERGTSIDLGLSQAVSDEAIAKAVRSLLDSPQRVRAMSDAALTIVGDEASRRDGALLCALLGPG